MKQRGVVPRLCKLLLTASFCATIFAQQTPTPLDISIHATTRVILVDTIVTDSQSRPVTGLKSSDFQVLEDGKPQTISFFSDESPIQQSTTPPPKLPPGVFTNRPEYRRTAGPLTIILLDGLNTPPGKQLFVREQILKYLRDLKLSGTGTAILALGNDLVVLQDFTTDPKLLNAAVNTYRPGRTVMDVESPKVDIPVQVGHSVGNGITGEANIDPAEAVFDTPSQDSSFTQLYQALDRFEKMNAVDELDVRVHGTLEALRAISHSVSGYSGRKTLLWFSAGFPFRVALNDRLDMDVSKSYQKDVKEVGALLAQSDIAIYPIDGAALTTGDPYADPTTPVKIAKATQDFGPPSDLAPAVWNKFTTQSTMDSLAHDTGGLVFRNTNDLRGALQAALTDSENYYRLAYYPTRKDWDGKFHNIKVVVADKQYKVRARTGYFAIDPADWRKTSAEQRLVASSSMHQLAATGVTFITHPLLPDKGKTDPVTMEILVDSSTILFTPGPQATYHTDLEFGVGAFTPDGKLEHMETQQAKGDLRPETYQQFIKNGIPVRIPIALKPGHYLARVAVRDNQNGNLGTLDVPLTID
jgi:VWFA-related protein